MSSFCGMFGIPILRTRVLFRCKRIINFFPTKGFGSSLSSISAADTTHFSGPVFVSKGYFHEHPCRRLVIALHILRLRTTKKIKQNFPKRGRIEGERACGLILQQSAAGTGRGVAYDRKAKRLEQEMNQTMWYNTIVVEFCNQLNHIRQVERHHGWNKINISYQMFCCVVSLIIIWQGKSERSDWFFLGRDDFTIRTVSTETVQAVYFFWFSKAGNFICGLNH